MAEKRETQSSKQTAFSDEEIAALIEKFLAIDGPDEKSFQRMNGFIQRYFSPTVVGLENIPEEPTLFIGNHAMEGRDLLKSRPVKLLQKLGVIGAIREDLVPPIPRGVFNTLLPKPERCFLTFGEPVEVPDHRGRRVSKAVQQALHSAKVCFWS